MTELLGIIAYMIKTHDKNGLDMYFATSTSMYHEATSSKLVDIVRKKELCENMGWTDMSVPLEKVLGEYGNKIQREKRKGIPSRGLNVYIFTDALWISTCNIVPAIDKMVSELITHQLPEKQVGLQFISFGDDREGLDRLKLVDNCLGLP